MPQGDAVRQVPTVADEMAKFKGFTTHNGETVDAVTDSDEEKAAQAASAAADATAAKAAKARPVKEFVAGEAPAAVVEKPVVKVEEPAAEAEEDSADDDKTITMAEHKKLLARAAAKRIGEVKRAGREALTAEQQRGEALERRLAALEKGLTPGDKGATEVNPDVEPKAEAFEFGELDAKYIRALARFEARQEFKAGTKDQQKTEQQRAAEQQAAEMVTQRTALEKEGAAKYADFDEVVTQSRQLDADDPAFWPLSRELGSLVIGSEVRADIVYHLASNPDEARKIFGKTPLEQAAYFGRLEAKFSAESGANPSKDKPADGQATVRVPKAPAPPQNRVRGSGGSNNQVSGATTDFAAFEAKARSEGTRRR